MLQHGTGFGGRVVVRCCSMGLGLVDGLLLDVAAWNWVWWTGCCKMLQHGTGFGGRVVVRCCSMGLGSVDGLLDVAAWDFVLWTGCG